MTDPIIKYLKASLSWLAAYSGATYAMIHAYRCGKRTPSAEQLLSFQKIIDALELDTPVQELASFSTLSTHDPDQVAALITDLEKKRLRLQERLEAARKKRDVLLRGVHACQKLVDNALINLERLRWVRFRESELNNRLNLQLKKILKLEINLRGVEAQLEFLSD